MNTTKAKDPEATSSVASEPSEAPVRSSDGFCRVCRKKHPAEELRNLNIYVFGSEGVNICHSCEMGVVEFLRAMSGVGSRARLQGYRSALEVREAKRQNNR